jgi:hypothetical protein
MKMLIGLIAVTGALATTQSMAADMYETTLPEGIKVSIVEEPFDATKHKITYCENAVACPCKVDGAEPFGAAPCELPRHSLVSLVVTLADDSYPLDTSNMYNAWEGRPLVTGDHKSLAVQCRSGECTISAALSDGAGSYVAEWKIKDGKSRRTLLSADEKVMFPFMEAMDKK